MIRMLHQFFAMLTTLFQAGERTANALNNLAEYGEETSKSFVEQERVKRAKALKLLEQEPISSQ